MRDFLRRLDTQIDVPRSRNPCHQLDFLHGLEVFEALHHAFELAILSVANTA